MRTTANNSLAPKKKVQNTAMVNSADGNQISTFVDSNGNDVSLSINIVKQYLCGGQSNITDAEAYMFIRLCVGQKMNPFLREAYLVKFGSAPAQMIVGRETFLRRAQNNPKFKGMKSGVVVVDANDVLVQREGEIYLKDRGEELVGGWAQVFIEGYDVPVTVTCNFNEACKYKDGQPSAMWATSPAMMVRKVALSRCLRDALPSSLSGLYSQDEMIADDSALPTMPIEQPSETTINPQPIIPKTPKVDKSTGEVIEAETTDVDSAEDDFQDTFFN